MSQPLSKPFRHHEPWSRKRRLGQPYERPTSVYTPPPEESQGQAKRVTLAPVGGVSYGYWNGTLRKEGSDDV